MVRRTHKQFVEEVSYIHPNLEILGEFIKVTEKILVRCKIHNYTFYATPDNLLHGKGCRLCGIERSAQSKHKNFDIIVEEFKKQGIVLLSTEDEIVNLSKTRLRYLCPIHGEQTILWNNFKKGARCRKCADEENSIRMKVDVWNRIQQYFKNSQYKLLSEFEEYTGANNSCLRCLCEKHGEFKISWSNLNKFEGCPICNSSNGERKIFYYLRKFNLDFERQKRFDGLVGINGGKLSFDFYLPQLNILIEYQGQQHQTPIIFFQMKENTAEENFKKQQKHDEMKREYAKTHNIKLLEIWYYDFNNIENILNKTLNNTK